MAEWIKLWRSVSLIPAIDHGIWAHLLLLAARAQDQVPYGTIGITTKIGYTDDLLAQLCGTTKRQWRSTKERLVKSKQIEVHHGNIIKIINWKRYQSESLRKLSERNNVPSDVPSNVPSDIPPLEREREIERIPIPNGQEAIRKVVESFKSLKGFGDVKHWDRVNFPRAARAAKSLLLLAGTAEVACQALTDLGGAFDKKGLSWTLETIVKHFDTWTTHRPKPKMSDAERAAWEKRLAVFAPPS